MCKQERTLQQQQQHFFFVKNSIAKYLKLDLLVQEQPGLHHKPYHDKLKIQLCQLER